ncbi:MAG: DHH family phosphoesterase [Bacteroidales bacterium]|nr:DHH family phosphoesterase [Bacteroidales bacterium]
MGQIAAASRKVATIAHTHPDGDAIGSSIGMYCWLRSLGKEVKCIFPDAISTNLTFMLEGQKADDFLNYADAEGPVRDWLAGCDLLVILDMNSFSRAAGLEEPLHAIKAVKILIDHHLNPATEQFNLVISEPGISSASELVYWLLKDLIGKGQGELSLQGATALMTGMTTDTNNFANSTLPSTLEMASELLAAGVDRDNIVEKINWRYKESRLRALGMLLDRRLTITPEGTAYMILYKEDLEAYKLGDGDTEGFVNIPLAIGNVRMTVFLKEDKGHFRVSVRSKKGTSAANYASRYCHGGGHENAAGGKIYFPQDIPSPGEASTYLEKTIKEYFNESL